MTLPPQTPEEIQRIRDEVWEENWGLWKAEDEKQVEKIEKYVYED